MLKRVLIVVAVIVLLIGAYMLYNRNAANNSLGSGNVYSDSASSRSSDDKDLDGHPTGTVAPTPSRSDAPGTINGEPVADSTSNQAPPAMRTPISSPAPPAPTPVSLPATDTVSPNPPNGLAFGGTGKFQWYRQGSLTWRVNTASGSTCIAFATMEEWQKPIVYTHGCGKA